MRIFKRVLIGLGVLLALIVASVAFMFCTQSGLKLALWAARPSLPQLVGISAEGTLLNLKASDVQWQQPGVDFTGAFGWRLNTSKLFDGEIVFDEIYLKESLLTVETAKMAVSEESPQDTEAAAQEGDLRSIIPTRIESLLIDHFTVTVNGAPFDIERFISKLAWDTQGVEISELNLKALWNKQPVTLTGRVDTSQRGRLLHLQDLIAQVGPNHLKTKGFVRFHSKVPNLELDVELNAPDFSAVLSQMKGNAKGRIRLTGPVLMPLIDADFQLNRFAMPDLSIDRFVLNGALSTEEISAGGIDLKVSGIRSAGTVIDDVTANIAGSPEAHETTLRVRAQGFDIGALLGGSLNDTYTIWTGALKKLNMQGPYGPIKLDEALPIVFNVDTLNVDISPFCLSHPQWGVCSRKAFTYNATEKESMTLKVDVTRFDLGFLRYFSPQELYAKGTITATADIVVPKGHSALPQLVFNVSGKKLQTRYRMPESDFVVNYDAVNFNGGHDGQNVHADWRIQLTDNGEFVGDVDILEAQTKRGLNGHLKIVSLKASMFDSLLSQGETAKGTIYGDITIGGTLAEPVLYGSTGVDALVIDSTKLPFEMLPSNFKLAFNGNTSTLDGTLKTRKGAMTLQGDADWKMLAQGHARVAAKGVKMRVTMPPAVQFDLTTDVHCQASAEKIVLDGSIDVPWARVKMYELPASAVDVSDDTVRLDRPMAVAEEHSESIPIESNLFINIGDDVRVDAMGLKASINGKLHVVQVNNRMGLNGQINVPRGQFKAYGQDLIVRRGEFLFAGSPDNPFIQLEAIRNPEKTADDVIAGIRVTGTADAPQVSVFSDPAKSDNEALSYLIRGEGLDPAGEDDNSMITSALINLGLSQGNRVLESLGDAVGISGLGVDTEGAGDSSKVAVSGYILPGLKVKYAVGLFDSLATITLRYRVIPRLYVEAASGVDQALDVLYSFEF